MKEMLKSLGLNILGLTLLPIAKFVAKILVELVKKSPRQEDDIFLKNLAQSILDNLK